MSIESLNCQGIFVTFFLVIGILSRSVLTKYNYVPTLDRRDPHDVIINVLRTETSECFVFCNKYTILHSCLSYLSVISIETPRSVRCSSV